MLSGNNYHIGLSLILFLLIAYTQAMSQEEYISNGYEKGYLKDGYKTSHWEYFNEKGELLLKMNHTTGKLIYLKADSSAYVIKKDSVWVEQALPIYPTVIGTLRNFYEHIRATIDYPAEARAKSIQGMMYFSFEINQQGLPENLIIEQDLCQGCGQKNFNIIREALEQTVPYWIPAQSNGQTFASKFILPVRFELAHMRRKKGTIIQTNALPLARHLSEITIVAYTK